MIKDAACTYVGPPLADSRPIMHCNFGEHALPAVEDASAASYGATLAGKQEAAYLTKYTTIRRCPCSSTTSV